MTATKRYDPVSFTTWLEFPGKPDVQTIAALKQNGWRWSGYRKQWYTNARMALVPTGITFEDEGACDYASERADRLQTRAEKHMAASLAHKERSDKLVEHIPFGQPILVGHHSERRHRNTLEKSRRQMDLFCEEWDTSKKLEQRAEASEKHQAKHARRTDLVYKRLQGYKVDLARLERQQGLWEPDQYAQLIASIQQRIAIETEALEAAGGYIPPTVESTSVQPGDLFTFSGRQWRVLRVNQKTITAVADVSGVPWEMKIPPEKVGEIVWRCPADQKPCRFCKNGKAWSVPPQGPRYAGHWIECEMCYGTGLLSK